MQNNILLKVAARALLVAMQKIPVVGGIIEIGRECWQALRDEQEKAAENERVVQLEQAAAITPEEARKIAQEVVVEIRHAGHSVDTARLEAVQDIMAVMPAQIHERTRATLNHARRLGTQAVAVLPVTNRFKSADREAFYTSLFPQRRPQFQAGNALPHGSRGWRLERLIGAGGFGEVWLARKESLTWAVKFCQDETSAALLKRESKTLNELQQKLPAGTSHLVALLDLQLDEMPYWLAFEYVDGGTLESRIRLGAMDWSTAWNLFKPILKGMAIVHDLGIVHRDLKPANILLDKNLQPRIADFGIGKILATQVAATRQSQRSQSLTTRGYGSLGYMSPEQAAGEVGHPADDVYALGVILWQMLMGTVQQVPEFPDDIADLSVAEVVKQALVRCRFSRRDKRPQTARELLGLLSTPVPEKIIVPAPVAILSPSPNPIQSQFQSQSQSQGQIQSQFQSQSQGQIQSQFQSQSMVQDVQHGHYIIHSNGTVTDTRTKLTWKRCCEGQTWDGTTCIGKAKSMTWNEIMPGEKQKSWPAFAGRNDWRVPTLDELKSLVYCSSGKPKTWNDTGSSCQGEYQRPTIDQIVFPNTPEKWFRTATPYAAGSSLSWLVHFGYGSVGYGYRGYYDFVRCVRLGQ